MAARRCDDCGLAYKVGAGRTHCPHCKEALSYDAKAEPDSPWPTEPLPQLTPDIEQEIARGWDELRAEAERHGGNWTPVDALEARG